jgi:antagonist of KipI
MGGIMLHIIKPGLLTTIQDGGRHGYQRFGVPVGGAMDMFALRVANMLVGNGQFEAAVETSGPGATIGVMEDATIAVTGADISAEINGKPLPMWRSVDARKGDAISFGAVKSGSWTYVGFPGIPEVLGSKSNCLVGAFGGFEGRALRSGDVLRCGGKNEPSPSRALRDEFVPRYDLGLNLRAVPGPQDFMFSERGINTFFSEVFDISLRTNRMGYWLYGPPVESVNSLEVESDASALGAVQVTGGRPVVLMADRNTTGGYAKIATLASVDTYALAQGRPGSKRIVRFHRISVEGAVNLLRDFEDGLASIAETLAC